MKLKALLVVVFIPAAVLVASGRGNGSGLEPTQGVPLDVWTYFVPINNPVTAEKVSLGRDLFFDKRLSADGSVSCGSCHDPRFALADGKAVAEGVAGRKGRRNSPSILNSMFNSGQFWDGRAGSLEAQARLPLINPDEMGNQSYAQVVQRLRGIPEYVERFSQVFGGTPDIDSLSMAIASFERTMVSGDSPFDTFNAGDNNAISDSAKRGLALFRGKGRCTQCHTMGQFSFQSYTFFSDQLYHNTGVAAHDPDFEALARRATLIARSGSPPKDLAALSKREGALSLGRFLVTGNVLDIGAFRTPSLRNIELTPPYFHDGSVDTLAEVVRFYVKGGKANPHRDWDLHPVDLSESEQFDIVEFLKSLTGREARRMVQESKLIARKEAP